MLGRERNMELHIEYQQSVVGKVQVQEQEIGVIWQAECLIPDEVVLRLYGLRAGCPPLRIGVPAPDENSKLVLTRKLSWAELRSQGYDRGQLPTHYILAYDAEQATVQLVPMVQTGDRKIDACLERGAAAAICHNGSWTVRTPFIPGKACALAFALTACTIQEGTAELCLRTHKKIEQK